MMRMPEPCRVRYVLPALLLVSFLPVASPALGGEPPADAEIQELKEELARTRAEYEERIRRLEEALQRLEASQAAPPVPAAAPVSVGTSRRRNAMNPEISVVGDFITCYSDVHTAIVVAR